MRKNVFVTSRVPRQTVVTQQSQLVYHPIVGNVVSYGCVLCDGTGVVSNQFASGGRMPCSCVRMRPENDGVPVPTGIVDMINARRQKQHQCSCQTHDHRQPVSSDPASIMSNPPTIADVLKARRAS